MLGMTLALYGLLTHYVEAARDRLPFRVAGWFDVKAQLGNVFYAAAHNTAEFFPNLLHGRWGDAVTNLTNMAGIRSTVYTQVLHAGATNRAEAYVLWAPALLLGLLLVGLWWRARCQRALLPYVARIGVASAAGTSLLLNVVAYYQGVTGGVAGFIGYLGSGVAQTIDLVVRVGTGVVKEIAWHLFFLLTDGKEKTIGWLTDSRPAEDLSHYLAHFPDHQINAALHTAVYQALVACGLLLLAHARQERKARHAELKPTPSTRRKQKRASLRTSRRRKAHTGPRLRRSRPAKQA